MVIKINEQITRKQHYVWQKYLRPWLTNGKLWWERKGLIRNTDTESILRLKDTYKIERLNKSEQYLLEKLFFDDKRTSVNELNKNWLEYFKVFNTLEDIATSESSQDFIDKSRIKFGEDMLTHAENLGSKALQRLINGDIGFFNNEESEDNTDTIDFMYFCCYQLFRTKKMKDNVIKTMSTPETLGRLDSAFSEAIDWNKLMAQGIHGLVTRVAHGLYAKKNKYYLTLFETVDNEFATSDQPIFNINEKVEGKLLPEEFDLYFPISKTRALLITDKIKTNEKKQLTSEEVDSYNTMMRKNAHEFFIGSSESIIKKYPPQSQSN